MDSNEEYSISPKTGRLRKKVRIKYKKKKPIYSTKKLKTFFSNPLLVILIIALLSLITYYFMPKYGKFTNKYRQSTDIETFNSNKRIRENDVYN